MTYAELLESDLWKQKRKLVIQRDNFKCTNCQNVEYGKEYKVGLIFSNLINHKAALSTIVKDMWLTHIWNFKDDTVITTFINKTFSFDNSKSYIAYYDEEQGGKYANVIALRMIDNKLIELNDNVLDIIKFGLKGKISEDTLIEVYKPITPFDSWEFAKDLHVHHKYYQTNLLPWDYPDSALTTLCWKCHEKLHNNEKITVLDSKGDEIGEYTYCHRCHGAGVFPEYSHVQSGICFRCHGARYEELIK